MQLQLREHGQPGLCHTRHRTNKHVVDSNYNNTEVRADLLEEQTSQSSVKVIAARSNAKAKPQKRETVELPSTIPMNQRKWIDIEPSELSLCVRCLEESDQSSSTQSNSTAGRRWISSILENLNFIFEINYHKFLVGQMIVGKFAWQQEEVRNVDISIALIIREQFFTSVLFRDTQDVILLILFYKTM